MDCRDNAETMYLWFISSGVHRLFEGQGEKKIKNTATHRSSLPLKRTLKHVVWLPIEHFISHIGSQKDLQHSGSKEENFTCMSALKRVLQRACWHPTVLFSMCFDCREGTLVHVIAPERTLQHACQLSRGDIRGYLQSNMQVLQIYVNLCVRLRINHY